MVTIDALLAHARPRAAKSVVAQDDVLDVLALRSRGARSIKQARAMLIGATSALISATSALIGAHRRSSALRRR